MKSSRVLRILSAFSHFLSFVTAAILLTLGQWAFVLGGGTDRLFAIHISTLVCATGVCKLVTQTFQPPYRRHPEETHWKDMVGFTVEDDTIFWQSIGLALVFAVPVLSGQVAPPTAGPSPIYAWLIIPMTALNMYMTWWLVRPVLWTLALLAPLVW